MRAGWQFGGLALFVVVDLLLMLLAFQHSLGGSRGPESSDGAARQSTSRGSADVSSSRGQVTRDHGPAAFLAVTKDGELARSSRGDCTLTASPRVEVSKDQGVSFTSASLPGLREVLALRVVADGSLLLVGLDENCVPVRFISRDRGVSWTGTGGDAGTWHLVRPATRPMVQSPSGPRTTPCPAREISNPDPSVVRLLCLDGRLFGTDNAGQTWDEAGRLRGAVGVSFSSPGAAFGLARQPGCGSAVLQTLDGGSHWTRIECLAEARPRALASEGSVVAAQVNERLYVSIDGGVSWPKPAKG